MKSQAHKYFASMLIAIAFVSLAYVSIKAVKVSSKTQMSTSDGVYTSYISSSKEIKQKAYVLSRDCNSKLCKVQALLDFVSSIPYSTSTFQQNSPQKTIQKNFGDCDDKSNLLISMLDALDIEAYFVLVPEHIFVIVPLDDKRLANIKGLWVGGRKYYVLESTAKDSKVGYDLKYGLDEIDVIIEPFSNEKIELESLKYEI